MKNKTILISSILVIMISSLMITGIYAYFTYVDFAENQIEPGNSEVAIRETFANPDIEPDEITTITKKVSVENTGINPSGVRIRADFSDKTVLNWVSADYNTTDWSKDGDWWYYKKVLLPGEETKPLFNKLTCNRPTSAQVSDFDVYLYSESRACSSEDSLSGIKAAFGE